MPVFGAGDASALTSLTGDTESCSSSNVRVESGSGLTAGGAVDSSGVITFAVDKGDAFA